MSDAPMTAAVAAKILGLLPPSQGGVWDEAELRHKYREAAKHCHPDKAGEASTEAFVRLGQALDLLLRIGTCAGVPTAAPQCRAPTGTAASGGYPASQAPATAQPERESERLDKHFMGTAAGSDQFNPRAWGGEASADWLASGGATMCVWRCKECPEASSVCCRMKPKKHSCICGHKVEAHDSMKSFKCSTSGCRCPKLQFHVQQLGWEAKCRCKHHVREHGTSGGPPYRCHKGSCKCTGFDVAWVCNCGHGWSCHETTWSAGVPKAVYAREWVAGGLRPECVDIAKEQRSKWESEAATVAAEHGAEHAAKWVAAKTQRVYVSVCAEAKMREAVDDTLDGSHLPKPPAPPMARRPVREKVAGPKAKGAVSTSDSSSVPAHAEGKLREATGEILYDSRCPSPPAAHPTARVAPRARGTVASANRSPVLDAHPEVPFKRGCESQSTATPPDATSTASSTSSMCSRPPPRPPMAQLQRSQHPAAFPQAEQTPARPAHAPRRRDRSPALAAAAVEVLTCPSGTRSSSSCSVASAPAVPGPRRTLLQRSSSASRCMEERQRPEASIDSHAGFATEPPVHSEGGGVRQDVHVEVLHEEPAAVVFFDVDSASERVPVPHAGRLVTGDLPPQAPRRDRHVEGIAK
eukprot:gnl/TRDRNA2_/TRDRNA2_191462_c0_seq1.p1 gnl/TRDRNA2_/TRDRNA2_191462_c0~~gnl/TRDRNA2_/TRDRNA2_191462_c0_seq1.p1  ORF type:complete len:637 (+),score=104.05 gnl/TRDRNA2_/TRDRNA2_191462_c0_seq1:63-1973(+)